MTTRTLLDRNGCLLGRISSEGPGRLVLIDHAGRLLGRYDAHQDVTLDYAGRLVGKGDLLATLLRQVE